MSAADPSRSEAAAPAALDDCWNRIGVFGDRSCGQLETSVHCRNCPVFAAAGRRLLEQPPPADYLAEWTGVLAETKRHAEGALLSAEGAAVRNPQSLSLMIFRLGDEHFALPVSRLVEVAPAFAIHAVPHRSNDVFLGLVNIRGEILLTASLAALLGVRSAGAEGRDPPTGRRMAVASTATGRWVFPLDEILGVHVFDREAVQSVPSVGSRKGGACAEGVLQWQQRTVALLDAEAVFAGLDAAIALP